MPEMQEYIGGMEQSIISNLEDPVIQTDYTEILELIYQSNLEQRYETFDLAVFSISIIIGFIIAKGMFDVWR